MKGFGGITKGMTLTMKHVIFAAVLCMACAAEADGDDFDLVSNRYDNFGRRVQKITPEATHTYFYDGWMLVKEVVERSGDTRRCGVSPRHGGGAGSSILGEDAADVPRLQESESCIETLSGRF